MNVVPTKDPEGHAAFSQRFSGLLTGTPTICYLLVTAGSVYGIHKSLEAQYPGFAILYSIIVAIVIQSMNGVAVGYTTRCLAAIPFARDKEALASNAHQKFENSDVIAGVFCLAFTVCVCYFDFEATSRASEVVAENVTKKPVREEVDSKKHSTEIHLAEAALQSEKEAEKAERAAFNASIDAELNKERSRLRSRLSQLADQSWAKGEVRLINARLNGIESERKSRKAGFVPQKTKVSERSSTLAAVQGRASQNLLTERIESDSLYSDGSKKYETKKSKTSNVVFGLYIFVMFFWHVCHGFKWYRALKFDEIHPENGNPVAAIFESIKSGAMNYVWGIRKRLEEWMPEDEVHGYVKEEMLQALQSQICQSVFSVICTNPGISEGAIYITLKGHDPMEVRQQLRWLKTAKLAFENNGVWTADTTQAEKIPGFFLASSEPQPIQEPPDKFEENAENIAENQVNSSIFDDSEIAEIRLIIEEFQSMLPLFKNPEKSELDSIIVDFKSMLEL